MQWSSFPVRRRFATLLLASAYLAGGRGGLASPPAPWHQLPDAGTGTVAAVPSGDTLELHDGRAVALASLRAPRAAFGEQPAEVGFDAARNHLAAAANGRLVRLFGKPGDRDRLGRIVAHAMLEGPQEIWLQRAQITAGFARTYAAKTESAEIALLLLGLEVAARRGKAGLWRQAAFAIRDASMPKAIPLGFQLVEGRVLAIGESKQSLFLNFGADWRQDFTVIIDRNDRDGFVGGLKGVRALQGKSIRVRGAVFPRGGPAVRVRTAYAIEALDEQR